MTTQYKVTEVIIDHTGLSTVAIMEHHLKEHAVENWRVDHMFEAHRDQMTQRFLVLWTRDMSPETKALIRLHMERAAGLL